MTYGEKDQQIRELNTRSDESGDDEWICRVRLRGISDYEMVIMNSMEVLNMKLESSILKTERQSVEALFFSIDDGNYEDTLGELCYKPDGSGFDSR
jgi:hypothetical protein